MTGQVVTAAIASAALVVVALLVWAARNPAGPSRTPLSRVAAAVVPGAAVDLLTLQHRMVKVALAEVIVAVTGERRLPPKLVIEVSPIDRRRLTSQIYGGLDQVCTDLAVEISRRAAKRGYVTPERLEVEVRASTFVADGRARSAAPNPPTSTSTPAPAPAPTSASAPAPTPAPAPGSAQSPAPASSTAPAHKVPLAGSPPLPTRNSSETVLADQAELVPAGGGPAIWIGKPRTVIGRTAGDVVLHHRAVSVKHAEVVRSGGGWELTDLKSTNGTFVNGSRVTRHQLGHGDRVQFAPDGPAFEFRLPGEPTQLASPNGDDAQPAVLTVEWTAPEGRFAEVHPAQAEPPTPRAGRDLIRAVDERGA